MKYYLLIKKKKKVTLAWNTLEESPMNLRFPELPSDDDDDFGGVMKDFNDIMIRI